MLRSRLAVRGAGLFLLLSAQVLAQPADSSTRTEARTLGLSGVEAYQAGRYDAASEKLEKAYAIMNVPSIGLWSARALAKRGLLVEAANRYFEVASLQVPQGDAAVQRLAQVDAQAELDQLRLQIPRLVIRVSGVDPSEIALSIDGQPVPTSALGKPRLVNPGSHRVEARAATTQSRRRSMCLPAKRRLSRSTLERRLRPRRPARPRPQRPLRQIARGARLSAPWVSSRWAPVRWGWFWVGSPAAWR